MKNVSTHFWRSFVASLFCLLMVLGIASKTNAENAPSLMPLPAHMTTGDGQLTIDTGFTVKLEGYTEPRLERARVRFIERLAAETGLRLEGGATSTTAVLTVKTGGASDAVQRSGEDESYHLQVAATGAELTAKNPLGVLHGLQTFLQLVTISPKGFVAQAVTIDDEPRFVWRGLMIDAGRHFQPLDVIERNLDGMEAVKMNVLHWHVSEDQGFRIESKVYPLLQEKGSNGQFYTQEQVKEVLAYARDRGIRVVPEFDMPCHTTAWFAGYPDLASGPGPFEPETHWGVFNPAMDPTRESTFEFLDKLIGEMTALFPDAYFHIGGDECNGKQWDASQRIQDWMKAHGMKNDAALQSYFTGRVQKLVTKHHKVAEGWDEVLQPDTPRDVVIQSWRGPEGLAAAAKQGNHVLLSNGYYIDLNQAASYHYLTDPLGGAAATLTPEQKALVLGGEATMWSEFTTPEIVDSRIWPRTAAVAERLWSPEDVRDVESMYARMAVISDKLNFYGLTHQSYREPMLQRMSGQTNPHALAVLASVVQPPEGYEREDLKQYDTSSALNRLVDAVGPESETAREFGELAKRIADGKATPQDWQQARAWLTGWRDNDAKLQPSLAASDIMAELAPLSKNLSQAAEIGLQALDDLQNHHAPDAAATQSNLQALKEAEKPQAVLIDKVVTAVEVLVEASGKAG